MAEQGDDLLRVGHLRVPMTRAVQWVRHYTDLGNETSSQPYAFPAYDRYQAGETGLRAITDADLLAPSLLNVPVKIRAFYELQRIRPRLEGALEHPSLHRPLAEITEVDEVREFVSPFYSVLDGDDAPEGVRGTTLSKVLHRKRPQSLVLHDQWVAACYVGPTGPVLRVKERTWAEYMTLVTCAIGADIREQTRQFERLDAATSTPGELSHVRLLDIVAWRSQGRLISAAGVSDA